MMRIPRRWVLTGIGTLVAVLVPVAAAGAAAPRVNLPPDQSLLFAVQGGSGTLIPAKGGHGRFVLTLQKVPSQLLWFTDRPVRSGGSIATRAFVRAWAQLGFAKQPPNAVITLRRGAKHANALAVELRRPRYDARKRKLTLNVRALRKVNSDLARIGRGLDRRLPRRFGDTALFIDGGRLQGQGVSCDSVGEIDMYPASVTPQGYVGANGQLLSFYQYQALTAAVGFRFGGSPSSGQVGMPAVAAPPGLANQVCNDGYYPSVSSGNYSGGAQCAAGALNLQATSFLPSGWVPADGRLLNAGQAPALYKAIGTRFGGSGQTFAVPTLAGPPGLTWDICVSGVGWTTHSAPACTIGELTPFGSAGLPAGYIAASGQSVKVNSYPTLNALIGTDFGGNGVTSFNLPNVPGPVAGVHYGICANGNWPG
jgi:microcystin-dependent protein